jgi:hypothetical protein
MMFIVSTSQQEINGCSTAFRYQLSQVWPPSFNQPGLLQKSKMELETKALAAILLIDTSRKM